MPFVQEPQPNVFTSLDGASSIVVKINGMPDVTWPTQILNTWSQQQLADEAKVYWVEPFQPPAGKILTGAPSYARVNGVIVETCDVTDPPVPLIISDRQFFQALALQGSITQQEALDAVKTGAIPAQMQPYVAAITDDIQRFSATMLISGAIEFRRDHPLVTAMMVANGWTDQQADDLWRFAASL